MNIWAADYLPAMLCILARFHRFPQNYSTIELAGNG